VLAIISGRSNAAQIKDRWQPVRLADAWPILKDIWAGRITEVGGPATQIIEDGFRKLTRCRYALALNSGTAALHSAFFAVGVRPGDEVLSPSYTFFATATPLFQLGARPVLTEIDPRTLTADPDDMERKITEKTKAMVVVHVWGNPVRLDAFQNLSRRYGIPLIEDCSHAHGATYQGRSVGSFGDVGCFSMQGSKAVSGGEAGIAVTNSPVYFDRMLALGHNGRTDSDQAANTFDIGPLSYGVKYRPHLFALRLAERSLRRLQKLNELRMENWDYLCEAFRNDGVLTGIEKYPEAVRGGFLEFIFRYHPERCGGWTREAFVNAVAAEGFPIGVDRYSSFGSSFRYLHEAPLLNRLDDPGIGGSIAGSVFRHEPLAITESTCANLVTFPAFARVRRRDLECLVAAVRRVGKFACSAVDLRSL
jgi:dTDP-4-amino-4,6-dideoxygalactose transaminase